VQFAPTGDWSTVDQTGNVRLRQPDRNARANAAHYDRVADTIALSGAVQLTDPDSVTTAQNATMRQTAGELHAEGHVSTIETGASAPSPDFAPGPARISSDRLDVNTADGTANYSGNARLWQGDSVVEAEAIDLDRGKRALAANGHVRAIFPQTPLAPAANSAKQGNAKPVLWHAESSHMTYVSDEGRCHLETNVVAHSDQGSIRSDSMDLFFTPAESSRSGEHFATVASKSSAVPEAIGERQLTRATGLGKVEVSQQDRRGNSNRADYSAADGKFVLSGGSPVVHDGSGNSVSGRQLTLFLADDTIVVDSAEGLRTLTLHPVGK
jgi:lipopolysaccharide export system protein LptA